jgi:stigma-specific protein Stig1
MSVPGFSAAASLYETKNYYRMAGAFDASWTGDVLLADIPHCPPPRQPCGLVGGPPWDFAFCCPPQAPVCCDPGCLPDLAFPVPGSMPGSPICTACCPRDHPDCCHQVPSPGDGDGESLPRRPDFFCPAGKEPCGVLGRGEGQRSRQACCEPGQKCCDPNTHFCCPDGTTKCCRPGTPNSNPVDVCCKPEEVCLKPGLCCPAAKVCKDQTCCTATQTCTTLDGCCGPGLAVCGGVSGRDHCCQAGQCCSGDGKCTDLGTDLNCKFCGNQCSPGGTCCPNGCVFPDIMNNPNNCGACGRSCPAHSPICSQGHCCPRCSVWLGEREVERLKLILGPFGIFVGGPGCHSCDEIFQPLTLIHGKCCNGTCTLLNTNDNCADCGDKCARKDPNKTCVNGRCVCLPGLSECGHSCVDTKTDGTNCGRCFKTCASAEICCDGQCVNSQSDPNHCGSCFNKCPPGFFCDDPGTCKTLTPA